MKISDAKLRYPKGSKSDDPVTQRVSLYSESYKGEYYNIAVEELIPFKNQARQDFDEESLRQMTNTIKLYGIRQPLTVIVSEDHEGKYEVISGERRWKAAVKAGLSKVPCVILQDRNIANEVALIENVQRKNLNPIELMYGLQNLLDKEICASQQEIANKIGLSRTVVVETLALRKLSEESRRSILQHNINSRAFFRNLLNSPLEEHQDIINLYLIELEQKAKRRKKGKHKHFNVLSVSLSDSKLCFDVSKRETLDHVQKQELAKYLKEYLVSLAS